MSKRSWSEAQGPTDPNDASLIEDPQQQHPRARQRASFGAIVSPQYWNSNGRSDLDVMSDGSTSQSVLQSAQGLTMLSQAERTKMKTYPDPPESMPAEAKRREQQSTSISVGGITRKVKACAACRKQKIKCIMENDTAPCRRCKERNLSCVLNKSLQTHMDDESRWRNAFSHDIGHIHGALDTVLKSMSLPGLPALQTDSRERRIEYKEDSNPGEGNNEALYDVSPRLSPSDESLAQVPIDSLYELTRLRFLRSQGMGEGEPSEQRADAPAIDDFISQGQIKFEDAEKLVAFYVLRLDHYIYGVGSSYKDLPSLRRASPILTACICTVSALHEPDDGKLYEVCNREFRRLVANSMFDRKISLDYLRALCIGSFWLSDISWTLSGMAVRRSCDFHFEKYYNRAIGLTEASTPASGRFAQDGQPVSMDHVRLWYLLDICDQHLSILYNRTPMIREDETILGWKEYSECSNASDADMRISSQVALLLIMSRIRDLFGTNTSEPFPRAFAMHIVSFDRELDKWLAQWSHALKPNEFIGDFPSKGVLLHSHFGKLHLCSHVFRGLKVDNEIEPIPQYFKDAASRAVSSATSILELLLQDDDLRKALVGVPHYFHTMIAFAGVFLLKVSGKYSIQLSIDLESVFSLVTGVINLFRSVACSKYHLVRWMAQGLDKMLMHCRTTTIGLLANNNNDGHMAGDARQDHPSIDNWSMAEQPSGIYNCQENGTYTNNAIMENGFEPDLNILMADFPPGNFDLGFNFL